MCSFGEGEGIYFIRPCKAIRHGVLGFVPAPLLSTCLTTVFYLPRITQGEEGVKKVLKLLNDEFVMALQLTGCTRASAADRSMVTHQTSYYSKL